MPTKRVAEDPVARTVQHRLRWLRESKGQSLRQVADATRYDISTVQRHETGAGRVDVTALTRYMRHFGVTSGWLLGLDGCGVCNGNPPQGFTCQACGAPLASPPDPEVAE